jgi:hypothetical protein
MPLIVGLGIAPKPRDQSTVWECHRPGTLRRGLMSTAAHSGWTGAAADAAWAAAFAARQVRSPQANLQGAVPPGRLAGATAWTRC